MNEAEIVSAITDYVTSQINIADGHQVNVDLKAGRGENGFTAILDISPEAEPEAEAPKAKAKPAKVKKATKPTLVEDTPPEPNTSVVEPDKINTAVADVKTPGKPDPFADDDAQTEAAPEEVEVAEGIEAVTEILSEAATAEPAKEAPPSIFNFNK